MMGDYQTMIYSPMEIFEVYAAFFLSIALIYPILQLAIHVFRAGVKK